MAYEIRDNSGSLFKNDKRRDGKQDPHVRGQARIDGKDYWLSGWIKETRDSQLTAADKQNLMQILGHVWLSLSTTPKEERRETRDSEPAELDDEIPF